MLDPDELELGDLAHAMQDQSPEHSWWLDPRTGELELSSEHGGDELDENDPEERGCLLVEPTDSREAYQDMVDFAEAVPDAALRGRLERALSGRGAFRRFKDELCDHPEMRVAWFALSDARMTRRAAAWLADHGVITEDACAVLVSGHPDPPPRTPVTGRARLAAEVAGDLRGVFGDRLEQVVMFGSSARAEADEESDLDLMVVLSGDSDFWADRALMDEVLWRHTLSSEIVISALPVRSRDLEPPVRPALGRAMEEGVAVA